MKITPELTSHIHQLRKSPLNWKPEFIYFFIEKENNIIEIAARIHRLTNLGYLW